ncbi:hypothetical protein ACFVJS_08375 [Nocardioides sp. NPDC057772]|uniref:hypothetical protein n=1 Tax=Nocardioides sp. NPDC057772 TaxID=3346245 RepID=UPI00366FD9CF
METSGNKTTDKSDVIKEAVRALQDVRGKITAAMREHARLEATLPASHGAAPDPADPKYAQSGTGVDGAQATENQKALQADRAAHAAREAAIAEAERIAAQHVQDVDNSVDEAEPKVRALYDDGSSDASDPMPPGTSGSQRGSYSDIQQARSRMAQYNSGTLYPDGWGHELIAQEKANIAGYEAENKPEWDGTQWINADGTPAPATSYAMVETADGLAPLAGGAGGMSALALAGGGALLGAGVAKAIASKFAAGASAKAATAGATSRSAAARTAAARAGAAGARAGVAGAGAGARAAGARGTGAGVRGTGAGTRGTGAGGRGAARAGAAGRGGMGAAGGRGGKKRDQNGSQNQEWEADYTDDWTETASDVLDPNASRGWVRNAPQGDESGTDKRK